MIKYYAATSEVLDFSSANAVNTINNWVSNETNGLIPQLYEYLIDGTQFVLADAFYFKCPWYKKFDVKNTKVDKFYNVFNDHNIENAISEYHKYIDSGDKSFNSIVCLNKKPAIDGLYVKFTVLFRISISLFKNSTKCDRFNSI